jgi:hypothetical protein
MDGRQQTEDRRLSISHTIKESAVCLDSQKPPSLGQDFSHCKEKRRRVLEKETENELIVELTDGAASVHTSLKENGIYFHDEI